MLTQEEQKLIVAGRPVRLKIQTVEARYIALGNARSRRTRELALGLGGGMQSFGSLAAKLGHHTRNVQLSYLGGTLKIELNG